MVAPAVKLYDFQKRWLQDKSRFKAGCWARQTGKSFGVSLEAVDDAVETGEDWVLLSAGERQSKEIIQKCKLHTEAYSVAASEIEEDFFEDTRTKQLTISFPNRARLIGLPANPDTARGFSANVILDEFAFHRDSVEIWKALFPIISRGYKLRVVSTPQGKSNKFYSLFTGDNRFSKHLVDIYQAVKDGAPHNIEELKEGIDDEEAWQQEFECKFLDEATAFLTYELIASCETEGLLQEIDFENFDPSVLEFPVTGPLYAGVDIGRKRDLTAIWIIEQIGDIYWTRAIIILRKQKFKTQEEFLWHVIDKLNISRTCIDSTGIGAQLAENTVTKFGTHRAEAVDFTNKVKNDLATRMLRKFQDRQIRIPISQKLRNDLHSIKKTTTVAGNIRFDAERTKDGHADRFWGGALSLMATDEGTIPQCILL